MFRLLKISQVFFRDNTRMILLVIFPLFLAVINILLVLPKFSLVTGQTYWNSYSQVYDYIWALSLKETGQVPLWNHYIVCGANYLTNFPFPFSTIRFFTAVGFSATFALVLTEYIFALTASLFTYLLLKKLGVKSFLSLAGGVLIAFVYSRFNTIEAYPLALAAAVLFFCEKYFHDPKIRYIVINSLLIALLSSTAIIHGIAFVFVFHFLFVLLYRDRQDGRKRYFTAFGLSWGLGLALALPTLLPQVFDALVSDRIVFHANYPALKDVWLPQLKNLLDNVLAITPANVLFPAIVTALASIPLITGHKKAFSLYFSNLAVWVVCFAVYSTQSSLKQVFILGTLINAFDLNRTVLVMLFSLTVMTFVSVNEIVKNGMLDKGKWMFFGTFLALTAVFWFLLKPDLLVVAVFVASFLVVFFNVKYHALTKYYLALLTMAVLVFFANAVYLQGLQSSRELKRAAAGNGVKIPALFLGNRYFEEKYRLLPDENDKTRTEILKIIKDGSPAGGYRLAEIGMPLYSDLMFLANRIPTIYGALNLYSYRYHMFFRLLIDDVRKNDPARFTNFIEWPTQVSDFGSSYNAALLSLMGVKWIVEKNGQGETRFRKVAAGKVYSLYENDSAFPLAFPVVGVRVFEKTDDLFDFLKNATLLGLREAIPVLRTELEGSNSEVRPGANTLKVKSILPNDIVIDADNASGCYAVLAMNYHKDWSASVDGVKVKIFPAYYTFMAVPVPAGKHTIQFRFRDRTGIFDILNSILSLKAKK